MCRVCNILLIVALFAGLSAPTAALAQSAGSSQELSAGAKRELASLMKAGRAAYDSGEFERSLRYFQDAYAIYPHPNLLYRIALSHEKLGEDAEAARHYRKFLEKKPQTDKRKRIERTLEVIDERLANQASHIRINTNPSRATVYINDKVNGVAGTTPLELPISPGNYKLIIEKHGHETIEEVVDVPEGQTLAVNYALTERSTGAEASSDFPTGPFVLGVFGVVSGATATYAYGEYAENRDQIERWDALKAEGEQRPSGYNRAHDDKQFYGGLTWIGAGVAVGSLTWAAAWWLSSDDDDDAVALIPSVGVTPGGSSVHLKLQF